MKTGTDLYNEAKAKIREVSPREVKTMQERGDDFTLLDVRDQNEVNLGKVPGAVHISRGTLEGKVEAAIPRDANVVIYCAGGNRSALAAVTMIFTAFLLARAGSEPHAHTATSTRARCIIGRLLIAKAR